jgi:hypothetical protein
MSLVCHILTDKQPGEEPSIGAVYRSGRDLKTTIEQLVFELHGNNLVRLVHLKLLVVAPRRLRILKYLHRLAIHHISRLQTQASRQGFVHANDSSFQILHADQL